MSTENKPTEAQTQRKNDIPSQFYEWIVEARKLVDAHFPNEVSSAHNAMVVEAAKSMMMMHKLGEIEMAINDIVFELDDREET
ncbi:hypothetical protein [Profundibacter amoris]|uniref:Uncharacterized protein n=1 Tax=Profundibacter amoris TaxID=2171755 RepID=A0A347UDZ6_9RHOB|nr:hypothetical protein [Profundibacter amoris]AXX97074.1 hypothetical protein BAR1_03495 [Profundibacter amoris]